MGETDLSEEATRFDTTERGSAHPGRGDLYAGIRKVGRGSN